MLKRNPIIGALFIMALLFPTTYVWAAGIAINLVVVNASSSETKATPIKYYLPKELDAQDVLNTGGLDLDYDIDKSAYYIHGSIELRPKESQTLKIEVKDVWKITDDEIDTLKKQIEDNLALLKKTQYYESGKVLRDNMFGKMDYILSQQKNYSDNIERRIEEYRAYASDLDVIRKNAFSVEYLKSSPIEASEGRTVKFIIDVTNPSKMEPKTVKQQHYLPAEIRSEHVIDSQGFDVRYDEQKQQSYITKNDEFKPGESKHYEIVIKNIWNISQKNADDLKKRAEAAFEGVKGSEYENAARYLVDGVNAHIEEIETTQKIKQDMQKYIGTFRTNKKHFQESQADVLKVEMLLASVTDKKLEELENTKVKNILSKMKALRGVMEVSQAIFGKKPTMTTTWRVIWGILAFVAFFTALHFFTWWRKSQVLGEELAIKAGGIKEVAGAKDEEKK